MVEQEKNTSSDNQEIATEHPGGKEASSARAGGNVLLLTPAAARPKSAPEEHLVAARNFYRDLSTELSTAFASASARGSFDAAPIAERLRAVVGRPEILEALYSLSISPSAEPYSLVSHSVRVMVLALRIAHLRDSESGTALSLGLAAIFHDVGLGTLPREVIHKPSPLTETERQLIRRHPERSAEIVRASGPGFDLAAKIILQVYEREDGSGYPSGLSGAEIHPLAKIVGIANIFEALTHQRPYRERMSPYHAVKEILAAERSHYPPPLMREFVEQCSLFPPQTFVRLNSNAIGRVVASDPRHPLRPLIDLLVAPDGRRLGSPRRIDLSLTPLLYITGPVDIDEAPGLVEHELEA